MAGSRGGTERRREMRNLGMMAGAAIILFFCMQMLISFVISATPLRGLYNESMTVRYACTFAASVLSIGLVFYLIRLLEGRLMGIRCPLPMRPDRWTPVILAIPAGFALCLSANYVSALVGMLTETVGVELTQPEQLLPTDPAGVIVYIISMVVIPPLVEEFAIRGVVMQPLLRYGRGFAICASAAVFGLMHSNPKQMVFAFVSGLVIGYFTASTGSLLTGIGIHLMNNAFAVLSSYMVQRENVVGSALLMLGAIGIGISFLIAYLILFARSGGAREKVSGGRWRFFINIVFILAAALMLLNASQYIQTAG